VVADEVDDEPAGDAVGAGRPLHPAEHRLDDPGGLEAVRLLVVARRDRGLDVDDALRGELAEHRLRQGLEVLVAVQEAALPDPALDELVEGPEGQALTERLQRGHAGCGPASDALEEPRMGHRPIQMEVELHLRRRPHRRLELGVRL